MARLTACRRAIRREHDDHRRLPVIFNDYMNTLMGDPTTERLLPLIAAAAETGAEYFCIDSGWYAGLGEGWWDTVGAWKPSVTRFTNGIAEVLQTLEFNKKSGTLDVFGREGEGWIAFTRGSPISASALDKTGEEAIFALLALKTGRFAFTT